MTEMAAPDRYGELIEPATLKIQRLLPGPVDRVWDYLTRSDLRQRWLAAGEMDLKIGAPFELVWRNDELTVPSGQRPSEIAAEQRMNSRITQLDPPRKLAFTWAGSGDVSFELEPQRDDVLLTVIHRRLPDRATLLGVSAGWHMHLDLLSGRMSGSTTPPFWDGWLTLREDYGNRFAA
jgi:uncharacterized protein YndB with AHSA1/START domain